MKRKHQPRKLQPAAAETLPMFCDYSCRHAKFAPASASGACRREQPVWCTLFAKYNNKNSRCFGRKEM